jgi:hypothetical protein
MDGSINNGGPPPYSRAIHSSKAARVILVSSNTTSIGLWETPGRKEDPLTSDSTNPPVNR